MKAVEVEITCRDCRKTEMRKSIAAKYCFTCAKKRQLESSSKPAPKKICICKNCGKESLAPSRNVFCNSKCAELYKNKKHTDAWLNSGKTFAYTKTAIEKYSIPVTANMRVSPL